MDDDIEPRDDTIIDPIKKLIVRPYNFSIDILSRIDAIGIESKNGICTNKK